MRCGAAETGFFGSVGGGWVFAFFEVEADLVETFFGYVVLVVLEIPAVHYGVDKLAGVAPETARGFDEPDALEPEGIPDFDRGGIGFVHEVEYGVGVPEFGSEVEVGFTEESADAACPGVRGGEEAGVANV